jgi:molecular chaperone DnaK
MVYNTEKLLAENKDKIAEEHRKGVEDAMQQARTALESDDVAKMHAAEEALTKASHRMAEAMYQATGSGSRGPTNGGDSAGGARRGGTGTGKEGGSGVIDAEFEESK